MGYTLDMRDYPVKDYVRVDLKKYKKVKDIIQKKYLYLSSGIKLSSRVQAYLRKYYNQFFLPSHAALNPVLIEPSEALFDNVYGNIVCLKGFLSAENIFDGQRAYVTIKMDEENPLAQECLNLSLFPGDDKSFENYPEIETKEHLKKKIEKELGGVSLFSNDEIMPKPAVKPSFISLDEEEKEEKATGEHFLMKFVSRSGPEPLFDYVDYYARRQGKNKPFSMNISFKKFEVREIIMNYFKCEDPSLSKFDFKYIGVANDSFSVYYTDEKGASTLSEQFKERILKNEVTPSTSRIFKEIDDIFYDKCAALGIEGYEEEEEEEEEKVNDPLPEEEYEEEEEVILPEETSDKEEIIPEEEVPDQRKIDNFLHLFNNINNENPDDETQSFSYVFNVHSLLNSKEKEAVRNEYAALCDLYNSFLYEDNEVLKKKDVIRKVYLSKSYTSSLEELLKISPKYKEEIDNLNYHLIHDDYQSLAEFLRYKNINKTKEFKKIRILNNEIPRIIFLWGRDFHDPSKEERAIYLVDIILDHNYKNLSPERYLKETYKFCSFNDVNLYEPTPEQKKYIDNDQYPLLCVGLAGSGKTTVSVYKYQEILNNYLYDKDVSVKDLVFLTFNSFVRDAAYNQLKALGIEGNCFDISSFFSSLIMNYSFNEVQGVYEFERWFNDEYKVSKNSKKIRYINLLSKKREMVSTVYTYYRGVFKGSMTDWERTIFNQPLDYNSFKRIISQKDNSVSLTPDEKEAIYDVCREYNDYLKENHLKDENDLAIDVIMKISKEKKRPSFEHIIVDEVQDLTEVQLYALLLCSPDYKIYLYGDQNQVINPTVFNMNKIDGALMKASSLKTLKIRNDIRLNTTFRSGPLLVRYLNKLIQVRKEYLGNSEYDDEVKAYFSSKDKYWARYISDSSLIDETLKLSSGDVHAAVIVNNEKQKEELLNKYGKDTHIKVFTVYEAKGLEWDKVILYNLLSYEKEYYEEIIHKEVKNSLIHRMIFNRYYVGCTRAVKTFLVLENDLPEEIENVMLQGMDKITSDKIIKTMFTSPDKNSYSDWLAAGDEYFKKGMYAQAKIYYETASDTLSNKKIESNLKLAEYMTDFVNGKEKANPDIARKLMDKGFPRAAMKVYAGLKDYYNVSLIKLSLNEHLTKEEILLIVNDSRTTDKQLGKLVYSLSVTNVINEIKNTKKDILGGK